MLRGRKLQFRRSAPLDPERCDHSPGIRRESSRIRGPRRIADDELLGATRGYLSAPIPCARARARPDSRKLEEVKLSRRFISVAHDFQTRTY